MFRTRFTALIAATVIIGLGMASTAQATVFTMSRSIGAGSIMGSIETDNTLGTLGTGNIVDWNLTIDDGVGSFNLLGPNSGNNSGILLVGSQLSASATQLLWDFNGTGEFLLQNPNTGSGINYWCLDGSSGCTGNTNSEVLSLTGNELVQAYQGRFVVGVAAVSEPATLGLFGLGLAGLGLAARRRKAA